MLRVYKVKTNYSALQDIVMLDTLTMQYVDNFSIKDFFKEVVKNNGETILGVSSIYLDTSVNCYMVNIDPSIGGRVTVIIPSTYLQGFKSQLKDKEKSKKPDSKPSVATGNLKADMGKAVVCARVLKGAIRQSKSKKGMCISDLLVKSEENLSDLCSSNEKIEERFGKVLSDFRAVKG